MHNLAISGSKMQITTGSSTENDRVYSGSPFPKFEYGFRFDANWKMFELSFLFQGTQGNKYIMLSEHIPSLHPL